MNDLHFLARPHGLACRVLAAVLGVIMPVRAQTTAASQGDWLDRDLAPAYTDGSFGFSIRPPAGSRIQREKQTIDEAVEVCRFTHRGEAGDAFSLSVQILAARRPWNAEAMAEELSSALSASRQKVEVLRSEPAEVEGHQALRHAAAFESDAGRFLQQQLVVRYLSDELLRVVFLTPDGDRRRLVSLFDRVAGSLRLLRSEALQARIEAALLNTSRLLARVRQGEVRLADLAAPPAWHRILRQGVEIGFLATEERAFTIDGHEGIQIVQQSWLFPEDGSVSFLQQNMFLSQDLSYERWENRQEVAAPAQAGKPASPPAVEYEQALRKNDKLVVDYPARISSADEKDRVIQTDRTFGSPIWLLLLPRLVNLREPAVFAFSWYDTQRKGLSLRTFEVVGSREVPLGGGRTNAFRIEDSEGLVPPVNEIDVDARGQLLRMTAGPLEMVLTDRQHVEDRYARRVREVQERYRPVPAAPASPNTRGPK